mmetsp:Transcript_12519/g.50128  ORF Transcript_12519/g.50128 Transcript_12519/m.50128 type:complete len:211 (-) Transcript_12519:482-1114(-)
MLGRRRIALLALLRGIVRIAQSSSRLSMVPSSGMSGYRRQLRIVRVLLPIVTSERSLYLPRPPSQWTNVRKVVAKWMLKTWKAHPLACCMPFSAGQTRGKTCSSAVVIISSSTPIVDGEELRAVQIVFIRLPDLHTIELQLLVEWQTWPPQQGGCERQRHWAHLHQCTWVKSAVGVCDVEASGWVARAAGLRLLSVGSAPPPLRSVALLY